MARGRKRIEQPPSEKAERKREVSAAYIANRQRIEKLLHKPNDDGTERLFFKRVGNKELYKYQDCEPLSDHDDPTRLCEFGLQLRDLNRLLENGCEEIADVRSAAMNDVEIPSWPNCGMVTLENIRNALVKADGGRR